MIARGDGSETKRMLSEKGVSVKVIGIKTLRHKYQPFEMRRALRSRFDVFLCDSSVFTSCITAFGKPLLSVWKYPVTVKDARDSAQVEAAMTRLRNTVFVHPSKGQLWGVKIGRVPSSLSAADLEQYTKLFADQMRSVIETVITQHVAGGWKNIRSLIAKLDSSPALPLYMSPPEVGLSIAEATIPDLETMKREQTKEASDLMKRLRGERPDDIGKDEMDELLQLAKDAGLVIDEDFLNMPSEEDNAELQEEIERKKLIQEKTQKRLERGKGGKRDRPGKKQKGGRVESEEEEEEEQPRSFKKGVLENNDDEDEDVVVNDVEDVEGEEEQQQQPAKKKKNKKQAPIAKKQQQQPKKQSPSSVSPSSLSKAALKLKAKRR